MPRASRGIDNLTTELLAVVDQTMQPTQASLAERLAQLLAGDEPKLGGGRVAQL